MKVGGREHNELMNHFEKAMKELIYGHKMDRVAKGERVPVGVFYNDGYVNTLFHTFMHGYAVGKCCERIGLTDDM